MRVVVDTNVVMSRYMNASGTPARILHFWETGNLEVLISPSILAEFERVFRYTSVQRFHHLTEDQIRQIMQRFRTFTTVVIPSESIDAIRDDPNDNIILECAIAGKADAIISGDRHLLALESYNGIPILRPAAFLTFLEDRTKAGL